MSNWFTLEEGMKIQMGRTRFEVLIIELEPTANPLVHIASVASLKSPVTETDSAETFVFTPQTLQAIQQATKQTSTKSESVPKLRED